MKTLVYRTYQQISSFEHEFLTEAQRISSTLPFTTREEYLVWTKHWKEDYKAVWKSYLREKYNYKYSNCKNPAKVEYYKKKLDSVGVLTEVERACVDRSISLAKSIYLTSKPTDREYIYQWARIFDASRYWLIVFMLIIRKASKLKATQERDKRIKQTAVV